MNSTFLSSLRWALLCSLLAACGGENGGSTAMSSALTVNLLKGRLIDSAVSGMSYKVTAADGSVIASGVTDGAGTFKYLAGETVTFSIGNIQLPPALAEATVTPVSMAQGGSGSIASNVAYFLQSLDFDLDPSNGISIDPNIAQLSAMTAFAATPVDWTQATSVFIVNSKLKTLWTQAKALNPANLVEPVPPPKTPEQTDQHLADTLFGSLDTQAPQNEGCSEVPEISKPTFTPLSKNMWADLMVKPKSTVAPAWAFDSQISQASALNAPGGDMRIYKPTTAAVEYKTAKKSDDADNVDVDLWLKHAGNPNVVMRIAAQQRLGADSVFFPQYSGSAIYLHYVANDNSVLEFQFAPGVEPQAFFSFIGNNANIYYRATAGKDGVINQGGDDGWNEWSQERGNNWFRHKPAVAAVPADINFNIAALAAKPADINFPPNLRKGGTTPMGRTLGANTCYLKSGGSVLLWRKPTTSSDLFFSPLALRNSVGQLAPLYTDASGFQGYAGLRAGVQVLRILK